MAPSNDEFFNFIFSWIHAKFLTTANIKSSGKFGGFWIEFESTKTTYSPEFSIKTFVFLMYVWKNSYLFPYKFVHNIRCNLIILKMFQKKNTAEFSR